MGDGRSWATIFIGSVFDDAIPAGTRWQPGPRPWNRRSPAKIIDSGFDLVLRDGLRGCRPAGAIACSFGRSKGNRQISRSTGASPDLNGRLTAGSGRSYGSSTVRRRPRREDGLVTRSVVDRSAHRSSNHGKYSDSYGQLSPLGTGGLHRLSGVERGRVRRGSPYGVGTLKPRFHPVEP